MALALIVIFGFLLRIFQLGADNFWIDEIGVARAARMPSVGGALTEAHSHVMAMPLDYLTAWLFARVGTGEAWLRLPAAIWGAAALPAAYTLFLRLSNRRTALAAVLLLAISPLHIQYSQELRFYSALVFFYLLSSALLLRAIQAIGPCPWIAFCLVAAVGILFHVYVLLAALTGVAWLWISYGRDPNYANARRFYLCSVAFLLVVFLAATVLFGGVSTAVEIPLFLNESFFSVFAVGLGWAPFYTALPVLPWFFGVLCFLMAAVGMLAAVRADPLGLKAALLYSLGAQIGLVFTMNALKNYFLAPRQFLFALPVMLFFTACGIETIASGLRRIRPNAGTHTSRVFRIAALAALVIAALPALQNYYLGDKGRIREISRLMIDAWRPESIVLVIPDYETAAFNYYRDGVNPDHALYRRLLPAHWSSLAADIRNNSQGFLITPYPVEHQQAEILESLALEPFFLPRPISRYSQAAWTWGMDP